jgi:hypothetical protein
MYIVGCLYLVVPRWWRIFGRGGRCSSIEGGLIRVISGPYVMTNLSTRSHTHITQPDSSPKTGILTRLSKLRKLGSLAQVEGASAHVMPANYLNLPCNRICPGRHLALRMLCFTVARILATFDILPPVDDNGCPRIPEAKYHKTLVR